MKILISGGYGCHNLGDDAQLLNNCNFFQKNNFNNVKIISPRIYIEKICNYPTILDFRAEFHKDTNENLIKRFYEILNLKKLSKKTQHLINEIKNCDVLFVSGSGTLNTRNYFGMLRALLPIAMTLKFKKRVILSGQGFSPMNNTELEKIAAHYLNQCEYIGIRDFSQGQKILNRIKIKSNLIHEVCDDAYTLEIGTFSKIPSKSVAFNLSCYGSEKLYKLLIEFADYLKSQDYNPIFNVFHYKDKETIAPYLKNKYEIVDFDNPKNAKAFFKQCVATIGMRYHSAILSISTLTPALNIAVNEYQQEKFKSINQNNVIIPCLSDKNLTLDILKNAFYSLNKEILKNTQEKWKKQAQLAGKYLIASNQSLLNLIKKRRSIRKFKSIKIAYNELLQLVEAGIYAPSGSNTQCYRFKIINKKEDINFLADKKIACVKNASAIILVVSDNSVCTYLQSSRKEVFDKLPYQDCAMAMQNICLLAEEKNIAQCIIHLSKEWSTNNDIKKYFNLKDYHELQGMILLGYADEIVDYDTATHAGRLIKRKSIENYLL